MTFNFELYQEITDKFDNILKKRLTHEDVKDAVELIRTMGIVLSDNETAHGMEDKLKDAVLSQLAIDGNALAKLALSSNEINYTRWYA